MITRKTNSKTPIKAITGTAPHPGTTFPCPELPMDLSKDPSAVFCPMSFLLAQICIESRYCMRSCPKEEETVETCDGMNQKSMIFGK